MEISKKALKFYSANIGQLEGVPENPRYIEESEYAKLFKSILLFPEMLQARPLVYAGDGVVLGGNQRLKVLNHISGFTEEEIINELNSYEELKRFETEEIERVLDFWREWLRSDQKEVAGIDISHLSLKQMREFVIKDNGTFGEYDFDVLREKWNSEEVEDWSGITWIDEIAEETDEEVYTKKIDTPVYEPKEEKAPEIEDIYDTTVTERLVLEIEKAKIPGKVKKFLKAAAQRHTVIDFSKAAEYYAHAGPEVQRLFEEQLLVIIDFGSAIEKGYVKLSENLMLQYLNDTKDEQ